MQRVLHFVSNAIQVDELHHVMNNILGENMTRAEVEAMVKVRVLVVPLLVYFVLFVPQAADKDSNGEIDFNEFKQIMANLHSQK